MKNTLRNKALLSAANVGVSTMEEGTFAHVASLLAGNAEPQSSSVEIVGASRAEVVKALQARNPRFILGRRSEKIVRKRTPFGRWIATSTPNTKGGKVEVLHATKGWRQLEVVA
jgi:hypothetical protein